MRACAEQAARKGTRRSEETQLREALRSTRIDRAAARHMNPYFVGRQLFPTRTHIAYDSTARTPDTTNVQDAVQ
jgi:hypothetical protein